MKAKRRIVIVGGGTAGWMAAAALSAMLPRHGFSIDLVESEQIGIIGVGEATLPHLRHFNDTIGIQEAEFVQATSATMKLGIEFVNWGDIGERYIHPFGTFGHAIQGVKFHQAWRKLNAGAGAGEIGKYSLPVRMCQAGKFDIPGTDYRSITSSYGYAYQFDANRYAPFLRQISERRGVVRTAGNVNVVIPDPENGEIRSILLDNGTQLEGDFFIDCTGFRGVLIEQALEAGYEDWSHWLPCDRAIAVPSTAIHPTPPYTRATAHAAGWQWRIPLQHRMGNGHVYASGFMDEDEAESILRANIEGELTAEPRPLRFTTGRRKQFWAKNCISVGLASGFLEPLESTSIHLTQLAITNFIELLPVTSDMSRERDEYNTIMAREFERVRDFLILHYHVTRRRDSEFWNYVRTMEIPASLQEKIDLFSARGRVARYQQGLFLEPSWLAVYLGQGLVPGQPDPSAAALDLADLESRFKALDQDITAAVDSMPGHDHRLAEMLETVSHAP